MEQKEIIEEIIELTKEKLEELNIEELIDVRKTMINFNGYCECGNNFKTEEEEEIGFCGDCR